MCENFHIMNINVPAGVGAPQLDTQLSNTLSQAMNDQVIDALSQAANL